jgi:putative nucleotidyltransferase with HDIG domain
MTDLLVTALDAHLLHQNGHGKRVAQYANRVARELGLDDRCLQRLHFSALLHDIGMLKVERALLENAKACEKHPQIGARMLERIRLWEELAPIVLHHHEWFDGTGSPEQLKGTEIPLESRIISVCEAFDAMISSSGYKLAMEVPEAVQELVDCAGTQFDPEIVEIFKDLVERGVIEPPTA